jgi:hypothetical protein
LFIKEIRMRNIIACLFSLFLVSPLAWADETEKPSEELPLMELRLNGATASIPHSEGAYRELAYVCERNNASDCAEFVTKQVAEFMNAMIRQTKAAERDKACAAFVKLEAEQQNDLISKLGGISPCRQ